MDMTRLTATPLQQPNDKTPDTHEINIANIPTLKLKALFKDIETELKHRDVTDKREALERMRDIAAEYGLNLTEVITKEGRLDTKKPKSKNADQASLPKYINPDNPDQTWSGRGQKPKWLKEALATGKTLEQLLIEPPEEQPETAAKEQRGEVFAL